MLKALMKRGTRAQLDAVAAKKQLTVNEFYYITDEDRLVIATSTNSWSNLSKQFARVVYSGTWASRPTSGLSIDDLAWFEDIGVGGALMYWNGSAWRATSPIVMYAKHGSFASPLATLSGVTREAFAIPGGAGKGIRIPAGLLAGGAVCEVSAIVNRTTDVATAVYDVWMNNIDSFATSGYIVSGVNITAVVNRQMRHLLEFTLSDSGILTRDAWLAPQSSQTGAASDMTATFNNTVETFVGAGVHNVDTADIFQLIRFSLVIK